MPSRPNTHPRGFFLNAVLMLSFLVGISLDSFSLTHGSSYHEQKQQKYPLCRRDKRPKDLGIISGLNEGNLSQHHAYLSCVWIAGGSDAPHNDFNQFSYYNSICADKYKCVAVKPKPHGSTKDSLVKPSIYIYAGSEDLVCGVNITELILVRRQGSGNIGSFEYLIDLCSVSRASGNPIERFCPGTMAKIKKRNEAWSSKPYTPPPNPCFKENESYYTKYIF